MKGAATSSNPPRPTRVVIADDHELARAGLRAMLSLYPDLEIVGEATTGEEARTICHLLHPDLVLMDVRMAGLDGLAATRAIKQESPGTSVLIVTMYDNLDHLVEALKAGAAGYLLKDATQQEVIATIRRVLHGELSFDPELLVRLLQRLADEPRQPAGAPSERLTPRELQVLRLLTQGCTNREIAHRLKISVGTVKAHVEHIIAKLGVSDRTQAAVHAIERGLLDFPGV